MSTIYGAVSLGFESPLVEVECKFSNGLPGTHVVGLGGKSVDESRERIRASFASINVPFPKKKILINLAPADLPKNDSALDLAMAIAVMHTASLDRLITKRSLFVGELALDGSVRRSKGVIGKLLSARKAGITTAYIPYANKDEASLVKGMSVHPIKNLRDLAMHISGSGRISELQGRPRETSHLNEVELDDIVGHEEAKRAITIAVAGGHNMHFYGPPGSGKSTLAKASASLMPSLTAEQLLESTHIHSLVSKGVKNLSRPPIRSPHHTSSDVSIIGGGRLALPGEIALAHNGVLFLDELPEFSRGAIESLRQPLEDGLVSISRSEISTTYPCKFLLIATSNPCPCGHANSQIPCSCTPSRIASYRQKLSGPIIDRIDLHVFTPNIATSKMLSGKRPRTNEQNEASDKITLAIKRQQLRNPGGIENGRLSLSDIKTLGLLNDSTRAQIEKLADKFNLSNRGVVRLVRIARTIADLDNEQTILPEHLLECCQYRPRTD